MTYKFRSGQTVRLGRTPFNRLAADGEYKIVRQLPDAGSGENEYRIKSLREPHERVVKESDLEKV